MLLDFQTYIEMGGKLQEPAFLTFENIAEYQLKKTNGGVVGKRIEKLKELPQAVIDCIFALIDFLSAYADNGNIQSESENQGGVSVSRTYVKLKSLEKQEEISDIINLYLQGGGLNQLLYRGCCDD